MSTDYNEVGEVERRRKQFTQWLLKAWEYVADRKWAGLEEAIADLLTHMDELDYPAWEVARNEGIIGEGELAQRLFKACGSYPDGPHMGQWEKFINYSPVIQLDEQTWRMIHGQLGWNNRDHDSSMGRKNFWLWSNQGNIVRFVIQKEPDYGLRESQ